MAVGVRSGIATLSQIDKSLDEASLTLGAHSGTTVRLVIAPAVEAGDRGRDGVQLCARHDGGRAIIFLVTAQYNMATAYIVGRVEAGEFGLAIAYSTVLIVVMLLAILLIQMLIGERKLGRRGVPAPTPIPAGAWNMGPSCQAVPPAGPGRR